VSFNLLQEENDKNSQLCQKISELEAQDTNLQDKLKHREAQLILQHQQSIQIMKQSIQVAVEDNNRLTVQVSDLESQLNDSQTLQTASQDQMDTLQSKLEELSKVNKANHQLGHEKSELEEKCSKLSEQLREAQHNEATQVSRDDNGQNEKLEHWKTLYEDSRNDKVHLENECSELKDKMEVLLQDLAELKQNLVESEQIKESNNILRAQLDHIKTENQTMKAQSVKSEDLRLQVIASRESQQIEGLKQALEEAKNSAKSKCSQLDNQIRELQEILEDSKHSETSQTSENCPKCHFHEEENQAFEKFIQCLKEKNVLLEKHNIESIKEADQFQCQLVHLQANLIELEDSLVSQTEQNAILKSKMEEALHAKASVDDILKKIGGKSLEHESNLESLQDKIKHLCEVDSRAQEYRDIQNNQQAEINELLLKLNAKDDTFEEMKKETNVYRNQYEGLLEEYQQYLQDLESLQSKSETLEKLKKMYEEEISEMQVKSNKKDEELVQANANIHELSIRDQERLEILGRLTELEDCLSKERSVNRELKASLDDKDLMISEFNTVNMKEILDNEEKEQDESENYRNKVDEQQELIHTLQAENKALQLKLEHQELKLEQLEQSHHDEIIQVVCEIPEESEVMEDLQQDNLELREAHMIKEQELKHQSERSDWNSEKQGMLAVLKEKTRDTSHLKAENTQLLQTISDEREHLQTVQVFTFNIYIVLYIAKV
jgi:chromosome segregation ATPase